MQLLADGFLTTIDVVCSTRSRGPLDASADPLDELGIEAARKLGIVGELNIEQREQQESLGADVVDLGLQACTIGLVVMLACAQLARRIKLLRATPTLL